MFDKLPRPFLAEPATRVVAAYPLAEPGVSNKLIIIIVGSKQEHRTIRRHSPVLFLSYFF